MDKNEQGIVLTDDFQPQIITFIKPRFLTEINPSPQTLSEFWLYEIRYVIEYVLRRIWIETHDEESVEIALTIHNLVESYKKLLDDFLPEFMYPGAKESRECGINIFNIAFANSDCDVDILKILSERLTSLISEKEGLESLESLDRSLKISIESIDPDSIFFMEKFPTELITHDDLSQDRDNLTWRDVSVSAIKHTIFAIKTLLNDVK